MELKHNNASRPPASLLTPGQKTWLSIALLLAGLMLANTLYLLANRAAAQIGGAVGELFAADPFTVPKTFQVMVLVHTGLGAVAALCMLTFGAAHLPRVWRRRRPRSVASGVAFVICGLLLAATGPFIVYASASDQHNWVWWTHVLAALLVPAAYAVHRTASFVPPVRGSYRRFITLTLVTFTVVLLAHAIGSRGPQLTAEARRAQSKGTYTGPGAKRRDLARFLPESHEPVEVRQAQWVPASFVPPQSPFFPSAATTTTGDYLPARIITRGDISAPQKLAPDLDTFGFVVREQIGADTCARCHPDVVEQWSRSAHRFASFNNPFYEATVNLVREQALATNDGVAKHIKAFPGAAGREGMIKSKWCSGCHDPAIMLAGKMTEEIDRRSPQAQAGLTCLACHAIDTIHNNTGNGAYNIADEQEDPYIFADAPAGTVRAFLHDVAIKSKPEPHKRQLLKPVFRQPEYCASCHKVSLQESINNYRWLRGQDEYDNWHDSGVALNAARTFYLPPAKRICQDCHMPMEDAPLGDVSAHNGQVKSHRFLAVNTALPFIRGDTETVERTEAFLRQEKLRIDVFALVQSSPDDEDAPVYALDQSKPTLTAGQTVTFDVVVRNVGVGHTFPGGTNDSNQGWIEFTVSDADGQVIAQSGWVGPDGYVDPAAEFFRSVLVDAKSRAIHMRNAQDIRAQVYANVIGPGTAKAVHYRITLPEHLAGESIRVQARLLWRKFDRAYTEFAYRANPDGFKMFDSCPDLPITLICSDEVVLRLADAQDPAAAEPGNPAVDWQRFNDYGIGLLLQGDTKGAKGAFAEVAKRFPDRLDGHRNLARVAIADGDLPAAYGHLLRCEELVSNDPQTAWFWAVVLQEDGRYVEAASAYQRVLQKFPEDRASWRNLGRTYYLDEKFGQAIDAFERVLEIDPENRVAYYHIMLSARALGDDARADRAQAAYRKYKIDESAEEFTKAYRLQNPQDNLLSQPIHVHELRTGARITAR
ncbi:MAG: tetratricopeptide repeat protein [Phycisphaerae bacterium]